MNLKFKTRIALFNTVAVGFTTALVFGLIYMVVRQTGYQHLAEDILLEKEEVFQSLVIENDSIKITGMAEWQEAEHSKIEVHPTFLQIVDLRGRVIFHSSNLLDGQILYDPENTRETYYNSEISGQQIRLGQFPIKGSGGKILGQLTIAISRQESFVIVNNLLIFLLIAYPLVLLVQFWASGLAASQGIAPVQVLRNTAAGISDSTMGTRLALPKRKDELYELTVTINELLDRIESSFKKQKQFTSDASHEMRTPLAGIRGTLEVLLRKPREPEVYIEKIQAALVQVDRLDRLLEQLLQLARIEKGALQTKKEAIPLQKLLQQVMDRWKTAAMQQNIQSEIQAAANVHVEADEDCLEIMLDNLVSNAIKYGRMNGKISLVWHSAAQELWVIDNGIGIAKDQLPYVFDQFYRVDASRNSTINGNGLGLSIVQKLADLQGIGLSIRSVEGEGTTFVLRFP